MKLSKAIKKEKIIMRQVSKLMCDIDAIYEKVQYPNDEELREATIEDIVDGAILWNPLWEGQQWCIASEVEKISWTDGKIFNWEGAVYKVFRSSPEFFVEISNS